MKKLFIVLVLILVAAVKGFTAEPAALKWDPSIGAVDGYIIEWVQNTGITTSDWNTKDVGDVEQVLDIAQIFELRPGISYTFRVYAYNIAGASGFSNTVDYTVPTWIKPVDTVIEKNIEIPEVPRTLILNFITPTQ